MSYTTEDYARLLAALEENSDETYRKFNESLLPGTTGTYGVRVPVLRAMVKEIRKGDWRGFLSAAQDTTHEERMLRGLVIAGAKCDLAEKLSYLRDFLPKIDNWAVCDIVSGECKWKENDLDAVRTFLSPYLRSENAYEVRFALVQLMQYFWRDDRIDRSLAAYQSIRHEDYYVRMALAWGLSVFFVKQREKTLPLLQAQVFPLWVHNKAIQKCRESFRVCAEDKSYLNTLKG